MNLLYVFWSMLIFYLSWPFSYFFLNISRKNLKSKVEDVGQAEKLRVCAQDTNGDQAKISEIKNYSVRT